MKYREWRARKQDEPRSAHRPAANPDDPWWTRPDNPQPEDPWWLRHAHSSRHRRRELHRYAAHPKMLVATFLIIAGAVLFLNNIGLLPVWDVWAYWPLILVAVGISRAASAFGFVARFWGVFMVFVGVGFLLHNLGILSVRGDVAWPILLIAFGVAILLKTLDSHRLQAPAFTSPPNNPGPEWLHPPGPPDHSLREWVLFGALKRRITAQDFRGGEVFSIFGEINIDLRAAQIAAPANQAIIEANANFGAVNITVPETWRVVVRGVGIFGGYEDKTIPPRPQPGINQPLLIITGAAIFGGVVVKN